MLILKAYIGDIVDENHEGAIVNAAKTSLEGGGGVDGAIHRAAGPSLLAACVKLPTLFPDKLAGPVRCAPGNAKITRGFAISVPHIIHTVGPVYKDDSRVAPDVLKSCYRTCMEIVLDKGITEISFPAIGTGIYGYPLEEATVVAVNTVLEYAKQNITINFVCFDEHNFLVYKRVIEAAKNNWCVAEVFK
jgi:O-acetyl-ADP-ribose deacetylase (regulator of RNase III)